MKPAGNTGDSEQRRTLPRAAASRGLLLRQAHSLPAECSALHKAGEEQSPCRSSSLSASVWLSSQQPLAAPGLGGCCTKRSCRLLLQAPRGGLRSAQGSPAAPQGAGKLGGSCALLTLPSMLIAEYFLPFSLLRKSASFHYCSREGDFFGLALQSQSHLQQRLCFKHTSSGYKHSTSPRNVTAGCRYYVTGGSASPLGKGKNKLRTRRALTPPSCPGSHTQKSKDSL